MTPAEVVIDVFAGIRETARVLRIAPSTVMRWTRAPKEGGTGGRVPLEYYEKLLMEAQRRRRTLTLAELVFGRKEITRRIHMLDLARKPADAMTVIAVALGGKAP